MRIIKIGRAKDNDFVVDHPAISSHHGDIFINDDGSMVYEDHSTNGTMINTDYIHKKRVRINGNERITLPGDLSCLISDLTGVCAQEQDHNVGPKYGYTPIGAAAPIMDLPEEPLPEEITFVGALKKFFTHYAVFKGRSRRTEFWYMYLWYLISSTVLITLMLITSMPSLALIESDPTAYTASVMVWIIISGILGLATLVPSLALTVRRLHDTGRSGVFLLFYLIPYVGGLIILIFMMLDSKPFTNQYGPCPKKIN